MNIKTLMTAAAVATATATSANAQVLSWSGFFVTGPPESVGTIETTNFVDEIQFDLSVTALGNSWGSELLIVILGGPDSVEILASGGSTPDADLYFNWANAPGDYLFTGSLGVALNPGTYEVLLVDTFNNPSVFPDAIYGASSISFIPAPGTAGLVVAGGLFGMRRRRR